MVPNPQRHLTNCGKFCTRSQQHNDQSHSQYQWPYHHIALFCFQHSWVSGVILFALESSVSFLHLQSAIHVTQVVATSKRCCLTFHSLQELHCEINKDPKAHQTRGQRHILQSYPQCPTAIYVFEEAASKQVLHSFTPLQWALLC